MKSLYEFFTGDGLIQGVFLERGVIVPVKHLIQTEKIVFETKTQIPFLKHVSFLPIYMILHLLNLCPNVMGRANTALVCIKRKVYALFERDLPYEIDIDFTEKRIKTLGKKLVYGINTFSAHPTILSNEIHSLDINLLKNKVMCLTLTNDLEVSGNIEVPTKYIPLIHDSFFCDDILYFADSPLSWSLQKGIFGKVPLSFQQTKPTYIHEINKFSLEHRIYSSNESFYIFHFAKATRQLKNDTEIKLYASVYDDLDFSLISIEGKYRELVLNRDLGTIQMNRNDELEMYNLDFPLTWKEEYTILRRIEDKKIVGFIITKGIQIVRKIDLPGRYAYGEPVIIGVDIESKEKSRIICFGYDDSDKSYLLFIDPENGDLYDFPIDMPLFHGFHSIFVDSSDF